MVVGAPWVWIVCVVLFVTLAGGSLSGSGSMSTLGVLLPMVRLMLVNAKTVVYVSVMTLVSSSSFLFFLLALISVQLDRLRTPSR